MNKKQLFNPFSSSDYLASLSITHVVNEPILGANIYTKAKAKKKKYSHKSISHIHKKEQKNIIHLVFLLPHSETEKNNHFAIAAVNYFRSLFCRVMPKQCQIRRKRVLLVLFLFLFCFLNIVLNGSERRKWFRAISHFFLNGKSLNVQKLRTINIFELNSKYEIEFK